eukprot:scaffold140188_cov33-Prasinocladus_malaysianus.AAC.5
MPKYKRPSRRSTGKGALPAYLCNIRLPSPYLSHWGKETAAGFSKAKHGCGCGRDFEIESDGFFVCTSCGVLAGPVYKAVPEWHKTSTVVRKTCYNPLSHVNTHLAPLLKDVSSYHAEKIKAVFPQLYKAFFVIAPTRKNFMSYGFVI